MQIKICGIQRDEDVSYLNEAVPDYAGFIFAPSRREISPEQAKQFRQRLSPGIKTVGVFVNAPISAVIRLVQDGTIGLVQLHGDETEEYVEECRKQITCPIIRAVRVKDKQTVSQADKSLCDYLLLDAYQKGAYGGTGESFSWEMIPETLSHPYFLAGGLNADNIRDAWRLVHGRGNCLGFDVSGGVETDGVKDREKITEVIQLVRSLAPQN